MMNHYSQLSQQQLKSFTFTARKKFNCTLCISNFNLLIQTETHLPNPNFCYSIMVNYNYCLLPILALANPLTGSGTSNLC